REAGAKLEEVFDHLLGSGREGAALRAGAADVSLDELLPESLFGLLDAPPNVAVALAQVGGRLLDGAGLVHRPQHFGQAEAESVAALGLQPDLDPWHEGEALRSSLVHGGIPTPSTSQTGHNTPPPCPPWRRPDGSAGRSGTS